MCLNHGPLEKISSFLFFRPLEEIILFLFFRPLEEISSFLFSRPLEEIRPSVKISVVQKCAAIARLNIVDFASRDFSHGLNAS